MGVKSFRYVFVVALVFSVLVESYSTQGPAADNEDESNPFLDMASAFLQETLLNQGNNGGGGGGGALGGISGIASLIGNMMQQDGPATGKAQGGGGGGGGAGQILAGLGSLLTGANGGSGFDPSLIGNVIEMFAGATGGGGRQKRQANEESGAGLDTVLSLASQFLSSRNDVKQDNNINDAPADGLMSLVPMVLQAINSFSGPEGQNTQKKHREHAWVLPPFLEKIHVMWDHFSNSELAEALWMKSGLNKVFKGFTGRDGHLDYDRLFDSLENQSFRRRWIKTTTLYLADWASYIADPQVYQKYFQTAQMVANSFLKTQGFPKKTLFDSDRPSETLSNLVDHVAQRQLNVKISSVTYVKPAVNYVKELLKLGQARGLLQKFNSTDLSDKLTDTLNLEVIEPVLKVHRAYRYVIVLPQCDKYVMCEINSHDPNEQLGLAGFKAGITKFGSMAAAWFISGHTKTPFWTLFATINDPYNCQARFPVDCTGFHDGETKVTTEYIHNEL